MHYRLRLSIVTGTFAAVSRDFRLISLMLFWLSVIRFSMLIRRSSVRLRPQAAVVISSFASAIFLFSSLISGDVGWKQHKNGIIIDVQYYQSFNLNLKIYRLEYVNQSLCPGLQDREFKFRLTFRIILFIEYALYLFDSE